MNSVFKIRSAMGLDRIALSDLNAVGLNLGSALKICHRISEPSVLNSEIQWD